jgi:hypothetical protein
MAKLLYTYRGERKLKVGELLLIYDDGTREKLNKKQTKIFFSRKNKEK